MILLFSFLSQSQQKQLHFDLRYTGDFARNFSGGLNKGNLYIGMVEGEFELHSEALSLWKGGTFFLHALHTHGESVSALVGDLQGVNNIEAFSTLRIYQYGYRHEFKKGSISLGQNDLSADFITSDLASLFIHNSFGIQPDVSSNVPLSIFPVTTLSVWGQWSLTQNWSFSSGVYKGYPGTQKENLNSLSYKFDKGEGIFWVSELHFQPQKENEIFGTYKVGFWKHTAKNLIVESQKPGGIYFIADQTLSFEEENPAQWAAFLQLGAAQKAAQTLTSYWGVGLICEGLRAPEKQERFGVAYVSASLTDAFRRELGPNAQSNEDILELTYTRSMGNFFSVQPNLQFIFNPSGVPNSKSAWVGTLRFVFEL